MKLGYWPDNTSFDPMFSSAGTVTPEAEAVTASTTDQIFSALEKLASIYGSVRMQDKLLDINMERAQLGLPPIDAAQYSPGVNVGLTAQTQQLLTWALIGFGALAVFAMMKR